MEQTRSGARCKEMDKQMMRVIPKATAIAIGVVLMTAVLAVVIVGYYNYLVFKEIRERPS